MTGLEQLVADADISLTSVFLWHVTFVYLIVLMFLSFVIYKSSDDKIFLTYFVYVSLLFTYIVCRNYYLEDLRSYLPVYLYSYFIQVVYLCVYFYFGLSIINFKIHYPNFTKWVYRYLFLSSGIGLIIFLISLFELVPPHYIKIYYSRIFFPVHISIALVILYKSVFLKQEKQRVYFIVGSIFYLVLGVAAVVTSVFNVKEIIITQISFFYLAIIIECTFFAIGLGIRVRDMSIGKLEAERKLNAAQKELQQQMLQQIRQQEEDNLALQTEKEFQTLATQVALLENKVLRSQMNSHFIFNVINSIKAYIIEQNTTEAIKYLNKFSKLIRKILNSSIDENSTLADELATIRLYVDIEKIRLPDELDIDIEMDIAQDPSTIVFPALLMQPFVENAIWHGLMPSHSGNRIRIKVFNPAAGNIRIEIIDNGIGYTRSMSQKTRTESHQSHGMNITRERIQQFNKKKKSQLSFDIEDVPTGGTCVWIHIKTD